MQRKVLLSLSILACAACSSTPTKNMADSGQGQARTVAGAPVETKVDMDKAAKMIESGVGYDLSCTPNGNTQSHNTPVTLEFYQSNPNEKVTTDTTLLQFMNATQNLHARSINAGNTNYQVRYGSLYRMIQGGHVRVYDMRSDLINMCESGNKYSNMAISDYEHSDQVKSLIGPYASYMTSDSGYGEGTAHPWAGVSLTAVNTDETKQGANSNTWIAQSANLLKLVDVNSLTTAMKSDAFLKKRLGAKLAAAKDIAGVYKAMVNGFHDCDIYIPEKVEDLMSQFAIYDYSPATNKVSVRIGMSYGCEAMRGNFTQLGLVVTPTPEFKTLLDTEMATATSENRKPYMMKYITRNNF